MTVEHEKRFSGPAPERRYLTIMFIDLVGFTGLSEQLDLEDLLAVQSRYQQLALTVMERFGGFVASFSGDGILVYFGYPTAHGNDAERALRAALEMTERLPSLDLPHTDDGLRHLLARIGVHTGLVIVGPELISSGSNVHAVLGSAANVAARLQNEAPVGGVVVSSDTRSLVEDLFDFASLGARMLRGLSRPIETFQVVRARPVPERHRTYALRSAERMVGRERALYQLVSRWKIVRDQARCQVVVVVGDSGIGKTRLVNEFLSHPEVGSVALAQTQCHEIFANTALFPVGSFLWKRASLTLEDDEGTRHQKLARLLDEFGLSNDENLEILASFPGLTTTRAEDSHGPTPRLFKLKQYRLIVSFLERTAQTRPTVLSVEDVHWLDPSSSELLHELAVTLLNTPLLMLLTTRSFPKGPALPVANEMVHLEQLGLDECLKLAGAIPGVASVPQVLVQRAVEAADGVPLFVEQLVLSLVDDSKRDSSRRGKAVDLPLILAEMMSERLDRRPGGRPIVQAAACLGRSFRPEFLAALLQEDVEQIAEPLEALVQAEILQPKRYGLELQYEFRHSLLQRMARDSMIEPERRAMHARVAKILVTEGDIPPALEVVAYHLTEAGNFVDAVRNWLAAGLNAAKQSAHLEAAGHLRRGLSLLERIPDETLRRELEISVQVALISSLSITQFATSMDLFACGQRGLQLCREHGPTPLAFPFIFSQFSFANCRGQVGEAKAQADLFLSLAESGGYDSGIVIGHRLRGMWLLGQGDPAAAKSELELSLALYSHERDAATAERFGQNPRVHIQSLLALALFCLGDVEKALLLGRDTLLAADALRHPHSTALALCYVGGLIFGLCEAFEHLARKARQLINLSEAHKLDGYRPHAVAFLGWAQCHCGELDQGIANIAKAIGAFDSVDYRLGVAGHLANLADAQRKAGRLIEAKESSVRAIDMTFASASGWLEPEVQRIDALIDCDLSPRNAARAVESLQKAAWRARELGSPVLERRCLLSLRDRGGVGEEGVEIQRRLHELAQFDNLKALVQSTIRDFSTLL
jgi:class 3 adenylate cyclase/tetratricopeptide (TPR) repeat protein